MEIQIKSNFVFPVTYRYTKRNRLFRQGRKMWVRLNRRGKEYSDLELGAGKLVGVNNAVFEVQKEVKPMKVTFDLDLGLVEDNAFYQLTTEDEVPTLAVGMGVELFPKAVDAPVNRATVTDFRWLINDGLCVELECCPPEDLGEADTFLKMHGWKPITVPEPELIEAG